MPSIHVKNTSVKRDNAHHQKVPSQPTNVSVEQDMKDSSARQKGKERGDGLGSPDSDPHQRNAEKRNTEITTLNQMVVAQSSHTRCLTVLERNLVGQQKLKTEQSDLSVVMEENIKSLSRRSVVVVVNVIFGVEKVFHGYQLTLHSVP